MTDTQLPAITDLRGRELAGYVADVIEMYPEHHDQNWWVRTPGHSIFHQEVGVEDVVNSCGTTACVAGWTTVLTGDKIRDETVVSGTNQLSVEEHAADLLGFGDVLNAWYVFHCYDNATALRRLREYANGTSADDLGEID